MSYAKLKKQLAEKRKDVTKAQSKLIELESDKKTLFDEFEQSYENLTDARARLNVGEGSEKEVEKAEKINRDLKEKIEQVKQDIDVQERTISLLREKVQQLSDDFKAEANQHYQKELEPIYSKISQAVNDLESSFEQLQKYQRQFQKDGITNSGYMLGLHHDPGIYFNKSRVPGIIGKDFMKSNQLLKNIERVQ